MKFIRSFNKKHINCPPPELARLLSLQDTRSTVSVHSFLSFALLSYIIYSATVGGSDSKCSGWLFLASSSEGLVSLFSQSVEQEFSAVYGCLPDAYYFS